MSAVALGRRRNAATHLKSPCLAVGRTGRAHTGLLIRVAAQSRSYKTSTTAVSLSRHGKASSLENGMSMSASKGTRYVLKIKKPNRASISDGNTGKSAVKGNKLLVRGRFVLPPTPAILQRATG